MDDIPIPARSSRREGHVFTVSEITAQVKETLESRFPDLYVAGEISQFTRAASGHVYLTLKDEDAVLRAVIWRGTARSLKFDLKEGLEVVARGGIDVYPPRGSYQLIVSWMEPRGMGALQLAYRQLLEKLEKEGLFREEHKKPLPPYPRGIGVVTSPTGAAVRDIINVITRRYPPARIYLYPCRVQGDAAAPEIAAAIERLNEECPDLDLLIVGRGGGSLEDLWAFNEEIVARAIFRSRLPIVSAVGHEVDFTIADFVADVRAATPTEAGEIVVPDRRELAAGLRQLRDRMGMALQNMVERRRRRLEDLVSRPVFLRPRAAIAEKAQRADDLFARMDTAMHHRLEMLKEATRGTTSRLEALSPLKVLERGYSLTFTEDGRILRSVEDASEGDTIHSKLHHGTIHSRVLQTEDEHGD
ncbi:MAG: exodeoxyribonuclease VII large subunit [Planctomycetota bacterium]